MTSIYLVNYEDLTYNQEHAMIRIILNAGLSVKFPIKHDQMDQGSYYVRLAEGWICVGRHSSEHNGECVYMHSERLDMETVDVDKVNHINLPLKEIMAMEDKGAFNSSSFLEEFVRTHYTDIRKLNQTIRGVRFRGFPDMPAATNEDDVSVLASDEPIGRLVTKQNVDD